MASRNPPTRRVRSKTLAVMDEAFASIWATVVTRFATMRTIASLELPSAKSF